MKKILSITFVLLNAVAVAQGALGDNDYVNKLRFFPHQPVKLEMLDDSSVMNSHMLIYNVWGAYYFEVISADTVVVEGVWCNSKSRESPESVVQRFRSLYAEDQQWNLYSRWKDKFNSFNGTYTVWLRDDQVFGIEAKVESNYSVIVAFTTVGGTIGREVYEHARTVMNDFIASKKSPN